MYNAGDSVPNDGSDLKDALETTSSRLGLEVSRIQYLPIGGVDNGYQLLIVELNNSGVELGDTVTIELNQFQDSNGTVLSGKLILTYSETPDSGWGTPAGWVASISNNN